MVDRLALSHDGILVGFLLLERKIALEHLLSILINPFITHPHTYNSALENTAAYHFLAPWMKWRPGAGVPTFRISSTYPRTAFFDFATYGRGSYMKAIDAIADYQILPTWVREVVRMHGMNEWID